MNKKFAFASTVPIVAFGIIISGCSSSQSSTVAGDCTPAHDFTTVTAGSLTVASVIYPPALAQEGNEEPTGIDPDIINAIAAEECLTVDFQVMDAPGAIGAVQAGRADIAAGEFWRSVAREAIVGQTQPTWTDGLAIISKEGYSTIEELEGLKVGDGRGNAWNEEAQAALGSNYSLYSSLSQVYSDLKAGRIQAALVGTAQGVYTSSGELEGYQVVPMKETPLIAVTSIIPQVNFPHIKSNMALREALDADIIALREAGTIEEIVTKYGLPPESADPGEPNNIEG